MAIGSIQNVSEVHFAWQTITTINGSFPGYRMYELAERQRANGMTFSQKFAIQIKLIDYIFVTPERIFLLINETRRKISWLIM